MSLRIRNSREINYCRENEKKQWHTDMKKYRREHLEEFWDTQTQGENLWIHDYKRDTHNQNLINLNNQRTKIARSAWNTRKQMDYLEKRKSNVLEKMRLHDIKLMSRDTTKRLMLDSMELYSKRDWPTLATLDMNIDTSKIIPQTIMRNQEYHDKLQRLAMYADMGDYKKMQEVLDNKQIMTRKNVMLQPLYRDLKSQIRFMSYTPEFQLIQEYLQSRKLLAEQMQSKGKTESDAALNKLQTHYADLLRIHNRKILTNPTHRLRYLQQRLENIMELLNIWQQYIDVIYMTEQESIMLDHMATCDQIDGLMNMSVAQRLENKETNERINMIFGKDED